MAADATSTTQCRKLFWIAEFQSALASAARKVGRDSDDELLLLAWRRVHPTLLGWLADVRCEKLDVGQSRMGEAKYASRKPLFHGVPEDTATDPAVAPSAYHRRPPAQGRER